MEVLWISCVLWAVTFSTCKGYVPILLVDSANQSLTDDLEKEKTTEGSVQSITYLNQNQVTPDAVNQAKPKYLQPNPVQPMQDQLPYSNQNRAQNNNLNAKQQDQIQNQNTYPQNWIPNNQAQMQSAQGHVQFIKNQNLPSLNQNKQDTYVNNQAQSRNDPKTVKHETLSVEHTENHNNNQAQLPKEQGLIPNYQGPIPNKQAQIPNEQAQIPNDRAQISNNQAQISNNQPRNENKQYESRDNPARNINYQAGNISNSAPKQDNPAPSWKNQAPSWENKAPSWENQAKFAPLENRAQTPENRPLGQENYSLEPKKTPLTQALDPKMPPAVPENPVQNPYHPENSPPIQVNFAQNPENTPPIRAQTAQTRPSGQENHAQNPENTPPLRVNRAQNHETLPPSRTSNNVHNPENPAQNQATPAQNRDNQTQNQNQFQAAAQIPDKNKKNQTVQELKSRRSLSKFKRFKIRQRADDPNEMPRKKIARMPQNPASPDFIAQMVRDAKANTFGNFGQLVNKQHTNSMPQTQALNADLIPSLVQNAKAHTLKTVMNQDPHQQPGMDAIDRIEKIFMDFAKSNQPSSMIYRAQQDYDVKPSFIKFRSSDHPSLKLELTSSSIVKFMENLLSTPEARRYADLAGQQAAVAFRALSQKIPQLRRYTEDRYDERPEYRRRLH